MTPGEIYWVRLPPADGHEQVGRRPAIILQDETYAGALPVVIVVPLTGAVAASRFPGTTLLQPTEENGLLRPSVVLVFQVRAVDRQRIEDQVGTVGAEALAEIYRILDRLLGRTTV